MQTKKLRRTVYAFFRRHARDLPWRHTINPYHILVSEVMLQQTQVDRVISKYWEFLGEFPTVAALAHAPFAKILKTWSGLGYNRRAKFLKQLAGKIVETHHGVVPDTPEVLRQLPGIGRNTAGAIAAYAYDQPAVFIETNIRSVFIHHFFADAKTVHDAEILPLIEATLDRRNPRRWYTALTDYGAHLKATYGNPNAKSSQYTKQSRFAGSNRQLRGMILKTLLTTGTITTKQLAQTVNKSTGAISVALKQLHDEQIIGKQGDSYCIADTLP